MHPEGLQLYEKEIPTQVFCVNIVKILRTPISKKICKRLLLYKIQYYHLIYKVDHKNIYLLSYCRLEAEKNLNYFE